MVRKPMCDIAFVAPIGGTIGAVEEQPNKTGEVTFDYIPSKEFRSTNIHILGLALRKQANVADAASWGCFKTQVNKVFRSISKYRWAKWPPLISTCSLVLK